MALIVRPGPPDETGPVTNATMLLPVVAASAPEVAAACAGLGGADSVFASVPQLHLARVEVLDTMPAASTHRVRVPLDPPYLLVGASFDGTFAALVASIMSGAAAGPFDVLLRCCQDYPGAEDVTAVTTYLDAHRVPALLSFATRPAPTERVRKALELHARFVAFAADAQDLEPAALRAAFRWAFP